MAKYRNNLPQLGDQLFLTDGGIETTLIFHNGIDLPDFASFVLLDDDSGRQALVDYFETYARIAAENSTGFVLESATWRANPDWAKGLGYSPEALDAANKGAIALCANIRDTFETEATPMVISGCFGPRGDGYVAGDLMSADEAQAYHSTQMQSFAESDADMAGAITMTYAEEAIGITRAAQAAGLPAAISFTVETNGRLPSGQPLGEAIEQVDAATDNGPAYFMINCAHPTHFDFVLDASASWAGRIKGIRANASRMSHAELDEAEELDDGNPEEFGSEYKELRDMLPGLNVLGGCCGTDHRHIEAIIRSCAPSPAS